MKLLWLVVFVAFVFASVALADEKTIPTVSTKVIINLGAKETVEEAVFEATYVINPKALKALVIEAKVEVENLGKTKGKFVANLNIPANYLVKSMTMYEEIDLTTNTSNIFQLYDNRKVKLFSLGVATGGPKKTPQGNFCLKRIVGKPRYFPPAEFEGGTHPVEPGPRNPYGLWMAEILKFSLEPAGYETHPKGALTKNGIRQHSTNRPRSIGRNASHGCVRNHPDVAKRLFPFFLRFTPHRQPKKVYRGDAVYPFEKNHLIYVKIFRSKLAKKT